MSVDIETVGTYKEELIIAKVTEPKDGERVGWIKFEGLAKSVKFFAVQKDKFPVKLEVGAKAEATIEIEEYKSHLNAILRGFGGAPGREGGQAANRGKSYGGGSRYSGGGGYQSKSREEIHATSISGIIKSAIESHGDLGVAKDYAKAGIDLYLETIERLGAKPEESRAVDRPVPTLSQSREYPGAEAYLASIRISEADRSDFDQVLGKWHISTDEACRAGFTAGANTYTHLRTVLSGMRAESNPDDRGTPLAGDPATPDELKAIAKHYDLKPAPSHKLVSLKGCPTDRSIRDAFDRCLSRGGDPNRALANLKTSSDWNGLKNLLEGEAA